MIPATAGDRNKLTVLRRGAAVLVALAAVGFVYLSGSGREITCRTTTTITHADPRTEAAKTDDASTTTQAPGRTTTKTTECGGFDAVALIPVALLIVILILPDLSEFAIPGVVSLKRQVESQSKDLSRQEAKQMQLETNLQLVQLNATQQVQVVFPAGTLASVNQKAPLLRAERPLSPNDSVVRRTLLHEDDTQYTTAVADLLSLAETLRTARLPGAIDAVIAPERGQMVERWRTLFADEIDQVLAVRNSIAHGQRPASGADLAEVADIARSLVGMLEEVISGPLTEER